MSPADYSEFQLQDFLEDDFFVQSIINPDDDNRVFWQSFLISYPEKNELLEKASGIILSYRNQDFYGNEEHKELVWQRITASVNEPRIVPRKQIFRMPVFWRVAAMLILVAGITFWLTNRNSSDRTYTQATAYGEIKTFTLPDNSRVTLNGNSTLSYKGSWEDEGPREVWIKGEGYFDIQHLNKDSLHIKPSEKFIVHCQDLDIEVLGTTFNVKSRHGKTNVALLTGKIRIDYTGTATSSSMLMTPGDYIEYSEKKLLVSKKLTRPDKIASWTSEEISFTDATLKEIVETLQDRFGYTVNTPDMNLLSLKIEGEISVSNVADLLDVVATTLNVTIEQSANKHIAISK